MIFGKEKIQSFINIDIFKPTLLYCFNPIWTGGEGWMFQSHEYYESVNVVDGSEI